jgi:hypothetical protein
MVQNTRPAGGAQLKGRDAQRDDHQDHPAAADTRLNKPGFDLRNRFPSPIAAAARLFGFSGAHKALQRVFFMSTDFSASIFQPPDRSGQRDATRSYPR